MKNELIEMNLSLRIQTLPDSSRIEAQNRIVEKIPFLGHTWMLRVLIWKCSIFYKKIIL